MFTVAFIKRLVQHSLPRFSNLPLTSVLNDLNYFSFTEYEEEATVVS